MIKNKLKEFIENIEYEFNSRIRVPILCLIDDIKNFFKYGWKFKSQRWWDYSFLNEMVIYKLEEMEKNWDKAHYVGSEKDKKIMQEIIEKLKKAEETENKQLYEEAYCLLGKNIMKFWD